MHEKILVTGGNGFIGQAVCRLALQRGHAVKSIARSGRPRDWKPWMHQVEWVAADVMDPITWRDHLKNCAAIIHCVGIVRERPSEGVTFERINGESTMLAADAAEASGVEKFVFLSAHATPPGLSERYLAAKRRAEAYLLDRQDLQSVILRPAYAYGPARRSATALAKLHEGALHLPLIGRKLEKLRPLPVQHVAAAAVRAITLPHAEGIYDISGIQRLAQAYNPAMSVSSRAGLLPLLAASTAAGGFIGWLLRRKQK